MKGYFLHYNDVYERVNTRKVVISVPIVWATQKCSFEFQVQVPLTSFRHSSGHCVSRHISQLQCSSQKHVWGLEHLLPVQP